ncbi:hypothetical protein L5515_018466 [Caenorhabditis briggsae]|uniref:Uncharacterized protein n=1 Tax=Caenorhabditis briggsae TaxID=6238 RepID=A0AAE9FMA4_CAEBR|nr:hypothetical protein L5515_018466 [Caenorhabditis briggsae]
MGKLRVRVKRIPLSYLFSTTDVTSKQAPFTPTVVSSCLDDQCCTFFSSKAQKIMKHETKKLLGKIILIFKDTECKKKQRKY